MNYALNSHRYAMATGEKQELDRQYTLSFDPGNGAAKRYTLTDGVYHWTLEGGRWDIQRVSVTVTIDNLESDAEFHDLVNGEQASVRPGEQATHTHAFPIEVSFDPGDDGPACRKLLSSDAIEFVVGRGDAAARLALRLRSD